MIYTIFDFEVFDMLFMQTVPEELKLVGWNKLRVEGFLVLSRFQKLERLQWIGWLEALKFVRNQPTNHFLKT